ncbi:MAG: SoxR reducing system RseC family protein [Clostridia bacterium]|jgi:sigma-E factor negative regulatory protein RseC|nr:SoxR reducing system RseC family protein [Clostridia bacterium]
MKEKAKVIEVKEQFARLEIRRVSACGESCASCKGGCVPTNTYINALNPIGAKAGEFVEVEMSTKIFLKAVAITYGLPLIMLFIGIFAGSALTDNLGLTINSDLAGAFLGFTLMTLSYILIYRQDKKYKRQDKIKFEVTRILV